MLEDLAPKAPDPLLKIIKMFREDPRTRQNRSRRRRLSRRDGATPVMEAVKEADGACSRTQKTKSVCRPTRRCRVSWTLLGALAFGPTGRDLVSIQAVGGTGALRLGSDLLRESGAKRVLLPTPSWPNHPAIIAAARLERIDVPFFDVAEQRIDIDGLIAGFAQGLSAATR